MKKGSLLTITEVSQFCKKQKNQRYVLVVNRQLSVEKRSN